MKPVLTDLITPFDSDGFIDLHSLENIIKHQLDEGCGIVLFGTTGECLTLTYEEKNQIMTLVKEKFSKHISNFVIGVGDVNTVECVDNIEEAKKFGFDTFIITCPYYNNPSQSGLKNQSCLKNHFSFICKKFIINNFIIYNVSSRIGVNLLPETISDIYSSNINLVGIKEASGDLNQMIMIKRLCPNILLYSGDDTLLIPTFSIGGYGVISVISNLLPKQIITIVTLYKLLKQTEEAFEEYIKYDELIRLMFVEPNPVPIKFIMCAKGLIEFDNVRLPLIQMSSYDDKNKILNCANQF